MEIHIYHHDPDTLRAIAELREILMKQGEKIMLDLTKLQAADAALAAEITQLATTIQTEATTIQAAIDALAALNVSDATTQAAIDAVTADLTTSATNLNGSIASVQGLPTTPTAK